MCNVFDVLYTQVIGNGVQDAVQGAPLNVRGLHSLQPLLQVTAQLTTSKKHPLQHLQRAHILRLKQAHLFKKIHLHSHAVIQLW